MKEGISGLVKLYKKEIEDLMSSIAGLLALS
jgi:hypothetical protein